jgi:hypothetical protein
MRAMMTKWQKISYITSMALVLGRRRQPVRRPVRRRRRTRTKKIPLQIRLVAVREVSVISVHEFLTTRNTLLQRCVSVHEFLT